MKKILQIEELAMTIITLYLITYLNVSLQWWVYILIFFLPDIGIAGYAMGNKAGAVLYNILHHKGVAIIITGAGLLYSNHFIILAGLILFSHASFDRIFGYGLKYFTGFKYTHLGIMK